MTSTIKKLHRCMICTKVFKSAYKLKSHLFHHKAIAARFKCSFCLKEFFRKDEFDRHVARHKDQQKMHICDHCGRGFVDKRNLVNHLYIHDDLHIPFKRYNCIACGVSYCEERLLKYHVRKNHMNLNADVPVHTKKNLNDSWLEAAMGTQSWVEITKVKNNMLSIKKSKLEPKREAGTRSTKVSEQIHTRQTIKLKGQIENDKVAVQQYLASLFPFKDNLYSKAVCDYCNKEMLKKSLIVHIRERHSKLRRFYCLTCNRGFNRHYQQSEHKCGKVRRTKKNQLIVKN